MKQTKNTAESQRLKIYVQMSAIHANTCIQTTTPLRNHCRNDDVVQQPPVHSLSRRSFNSFTSWIRER